MNTVYDHVLDGRDGDLLDAANKRIYVKAIDEDQAFHLISLLSLRKSELHRLHDGTLTVNIK
jgi:hypothetical protein